MNPPDELYILTDATGFTSAIETSVNKSPRDNHAAVLRESGRRPMMAPIKIAYWRRKHETGPHGGYVLVVEWEWKGGDFGS